MSSSAPKDNVQNPLGYSQFLVVQWVLTGFALLATIGRFTLRLRLQWRLNPHDWCHGCAMVTLIVYMALWSVLFPISNAIQLYSVGQGSKPSNSELEKFLRLVVPSEILFWVVLYLVKFTFLLLYRQIFGVNKQFKKYWWAVFAYTFITFWAAFLTVFWTCGTPSKLFNLQACLSKKARDVTNNYAETMVALNIAGDLAIIALPLWMLRKLQMKKTQKAGLAAVFLMAAVVIFFDIARIAIGDGGGTISLASLWDILEPATAVIISSLVPYRHCLTVSRRQRGNKSDTPSNPSAKHGGSATKSMESHEPHGTDLSSEQPQQTEAKYSTVTTEIPSMREGNTIAE